MANHKKQFCPKGHDTFVGGRLSGGCLVCRRDASRRRTIEQPQAVHAAIKKWSLANKDRIKTTRYKREYGISLVDYNQMYDEQKGFCQICSCWFLTLVVDHDHATNKIRGLLCSQCNRAMGLFQDNPLRLRAAVEYLEARTAVA